MYTGSIPVLASNLDFSVSSRYCNELEQSTGNTNTQTAKQNTGSMLWQFLETDDDLAYGFAVSDGAIYL